MPYARAAIFRFKTGADVEEVVRRVRERASGLRQQPGFVSYTAIRTGDREAIALTLWDTEPQAEQGARSADRWNRANVASLLESAEAYLGEVLIHELAPGSA